MEEMASVGVQRATALYQNFSAANTATKVELLCLLSFAISLLGSLSKFPVGANTSVALLGLLACRATSELQILAMVGFACLSAIADVAFLCTYPSGWGGLMIVLNLVPKLAAASYCFGMSPALGGVFEPAGMSAQQGLSVPLAPDYETLSSEAAAKHAAGQSSVGEATHYRPI